MSEPQTPQEVYRALQQRDRREGRGTQELFEFYLLERFLYRLSVSPYRDRFVLNGGLLLTVLGARRPTRDADALARGVAGNEENLLAVVGEIAGLPAGDGVAFDPLAARAAVIRSRRNASVRNSRQMQGRAPDTSSVRRGQCHLEAACGIALIKVETRIDTDRARKYVLRCFA